MVEQPDWEINNLARLCTSLNMVLAKQEKIFEKDFRAGFPQLKLLKKVENQPINKNF